MSPRLRLSDCVAGKAFLAAALFALTAVSVPEVSYAQGFCIQKPVNCRISSGFGYRVQPVVPGRPGGFTAFHNGMDFACAKGTPVGAVAEGQITISDFSDSAGNWVVKKAGGYTIKYMHHVRNAVHAGQRVAAGTVVGYVGSTGFSSGDHLHLQVENAQGTPVDPQTMWCDGPAPTPSSVLDGDSPERNTDHDLTITRGAPPSNPPAAPIGLEGSVLTIAAGVVGSRAFNPDYAAQLATLDTARLIGEYTYMEGLSLRLRQEREKSKERKEAIEAAILALRTEILRRRAEEAKGSAVAGGVAKR